jgi:hypothetical protein
MQHKTDISPRAVFEHRSYYVNFASHLLNSWNANMMHENAGNRWGEAEFAGFLDMIKAFGFTCFEYWLERARGLKTVYITAPDTIGHQFSTEPEGMYDFSHSFVASRRRSAKLSLGSSNFSHVLIHLLSIS